MARAASLQKAAESQQTVTLQGLATGQQVENTLQPRKAPAGPVQVCELQVSSQALHALGAGTSLEKMSPPSPWLPWGSCEFWVTLCPPLRFSYRIVQERASLSPPCEILRKPLGRENIFGRSLRNLFSPVLKTLVPPGSRNELIPMPMTFTVHSSLHLT